ncbi:GNAT family N-acetyltransferase [Ponticaulis sp.]|uniref:GNAT family N-acetyltransferase n=1 Tax=Ponticaulis sp. TaxID=2020902 RepID=UPI002614970C|nr:GNAT family N-acetyltransferase [Ponticaulis sp.]MDF1679834.1 GNAT family N-acetyltransferase [Ponticaulis sp.]
MPFPPSLRFSDLNTLSGADLTKLADLQAASLEEAWSLQTLTSMIQTQSAFGLGVFDGEACVGLTVYLPCVDDCELLSIATAPVLRGKGLAKHMLDEGEKAAQGSGFDRILLEVADDNLAARALYQHHGFSEDGRRKGYYTRADSPARDAILMSKPIK